MKRLPKEYPKNPVTIGEHLKKRRLDLKMKQPEVAKIIGVCSNVISRWETNREKPTRKHIQAIENFIG